VNISSEMTAFGRHIRGDMSLLTGCLSTHDPLGQGVLSGCQVVVTTPQVAVTQLYYDIFTAASKIQGESNELHKFSDDICLPGVWRIHVHW
jgi:hypothetical protein